MKQIIDSTPSYSSAIGLCPPEVYGLQTLRHTRFIIFEESRGSHYIDFTEYPIRKDTLYIIPEHHYHYLDNNTGNRFVCTHASAELLSPFHKRQLHALRYRKEKLVAADSGNGLSFERFRTFAESQPSFSAMRIFLSACLPQSSRENARAQHHQDRAERFITALRERRISHNMNIGTEFCDLLNIHERTLRRACNAVFGLAPRNIIRYHLNTQALFLLAHHQYSVSEIADILGFSNVATFTRYVKAVTGHTPSRIRSHYLHLSR